ncbi:MAG: polyprenol monophosphomannose synthase [bacterium]|nr:polyprenol monophosphomannose synthase [bacterium]MDZ4342243.1 polyprenol monophosphomannose synthase [Candidatus Binatia bacterium]
MNNPWVVIPTYNEKMNIEQMIKSLFALNVPNISVLIIDDNSPDRTADIVRRLQTNFPKLQLVVRPKKSGLGRAYIHGFQYAVAKGADSVVQMDADFSHNPHDVPRLLQHLESSDVVIGSRYVNGISIVNWPLRRLLLSIGGNAYAGFITGLPFKDSTGGFRAWRSSALQTIDLPTIRADGYGFQVITIFRSWRRHLRIKEIPIVFTERRAGKSKMSGKIVREAMAIVWKLRLTGK